jgi:hypothetical protein
MLTTAQRNLWWWLRTWACTLRARRNPLSALMQPTTGHDSKPEFAWHFMCAERLDLCLNFDPHWWHLKPATSLCVCNTYWTISEHKKPYSGRNCNWIWCYLLNPTVTKLGTRCPESKFRLRIPAAQVAWAWCACAVMSQEPRRLHQTRCQLSFFVYKFIILSWNEYENRKSCQLWDTVSDQISECQICLPSWNLLASL